MSSIDRNALMAMWASILVVITNGDWESMLIAVVTFIIVFTVFCLFERW